MGVDSFRSARNMVNWFVSNSATSAALNVVITSSSDASFHL